MTKFIALRKAFGFDSVARDLADNLSANWSRDNVQKILAGMKSRRLTYRGPRRLVNLSLTAARAFAAPQSKPRDFTAPYFQ